MSNKVLVTGASGFLGARIVRALVEAGETVKVLVRASSSLQALEGLSRSQVEVIEGDVRVEHTVFRALAGCDRLLHVAAIHKLWARDPDEIFETVVQGTETTLTAARKRKIRRAVVTSSVTTLGATAAAEEMTEEHTADLSGFDYAEAKFEAEKVAFSFQDQLEIIAALPSVMIGPGDVRPTPIGQGLLRFLAWNLPLMDFPVVGGGSNFVDVDDVAHGHLLLLAKGVPGQRYLLGGENLSYEEVLSLAADLAGVEGPGAVMNKGTAQTLAFLAEIRAWLGGPDPLFGRATTTMYADAYAWISSAKAEALGYTHRPVRRALARGIQWFLENGYLQEGSARRLRIHLRTPG